MLNRPPGTKDNNNNKEIITETRINRLIKNLSNNMENVGDIPVKRVLTCVNFSESAPAVVVGDSNGTVTVYRVMDPVVVTQMGPLQQIDKIRDALMR
jgi:hypothetical protein